MTYLIDQQGISSEAQALIAEKAYCNESLRRLVPLLPQDDAELEDWIRQTGEAFDNDSFLFLITAAGIGGRSLPASLLPRAILMQAPAWVLGWIAWRMQGNVTMELLRGLAEGLCSKEANAVVLFVAAAWWQEHHPEMEVPRQIARSAMHLLEDEKIEARVQAVIGNLAVLLGDTKMAVKARTMLPQGDLAQRRKYLAKTFAILEDPLTKLLYERNTWAYSGPKPMRRAVPKVGRNEPCPCGSGEKYKDCCDKPDHERLRQSSSVPGVTRTEIVPETGVMLTEARMDAMRPADVLRVDLAQVPRELQVRYVLSLAELKHFEKAIAALRHFGMGEHLYSTWSHMFQLANGSWRPEIARGLLEIFPDAPEKLGCPPHAGIRVLLVGDNPAAVLQEVENSIRTILKSGDIQELLKLISGVLASPYQALGVLLARSLLPIVEEKCVPSLFDAILDARAKLELSPEDEFSDWMAEHALHKARKNETEANHEAQDKLEAKMEELRRAKEEIARNDRELARLRRSERAEAEESKIISFPPPDKARERELERKNKELSALVNERNEQKRTLLRDLQKANKEVETLRESAALQEKSEEKSDDERYVVEGKQPVRIIVFPKDFPERLTAPPPHIARAAMNRLGRLAAGEPSAFDHLKQLKAYPGVLRARISDRYRLLFSLLPDRIRVVDLTYRPDLDATADRLKLCGLPPVG